MPQTTALSVKAMMVLVAKHTFVMDKFTVETWVQVHQVWCVGMSIPAVCHWSRCSAGKRAVEWHYESVTEPSWGFMTVKPSARGVASVVLVSCYWPNDKLSRWTWSFLTPLEQCFPNLSWRPPALHLLYVSFNTPDSTHQLVNRDCKN